MNVTRIHELEIRDMVEALTDLLGRAREGRLKGLAVAIKTGPKRHNYGFMGEYWRDPHEALACITRMEYKANQLISSRDDQPDTSHLPL